MLEARVARVERRHAELETQAHLERRRVFVEEAIGTGRWPEKKRAELEKAFDSDPAAVAAIVDAMPVDRRRAVSRSMTDDESRAYRASAAARFGRSFADPV